MHSIKNTYLFRFKLFVLIPDKEVKDFFCSLSYLNGFRYVDFGLKISSND